MAINSQPGNQGWQMRTFNLGLLVKQAGCSRKKTRMSGEIVTDIYRGGNKACEAAVPKVDDYYPMSRTVLVTGYELVYEEGGQACLTITYQGLFLTQSFNQLPPPVYEMELAGTDEPIATHPDFVTVLGGTVAAPLHRAFFGKPGSDHEGVFVGFQPNQDNIGIGTSMLGGVTSFLCPRGHYKVHYQQFSAPVLDPTTDQIVDQYGPPPSANLGGVGLIGSPPGEPIAGTQSQNWLKSGISFTRQGALYQVTETWLLSAYGGWNPLIYHS